MKSLMFFLAAATLIFLAGCSSLKVASTTAEGSNLRQYNFYTLADTEEGFLPAINPVQKSQIEKAIDREARAVSTSANNSGVAGPDVLVSYFVLVDTKQDAEAYTNYYGRRRWQYAITDVTIREYKEGTLLVDFIDARTRKVVWHGSTSGLLTPDSVKMEEKINHAVQAIFQQYKKDQQQ